MEWLTGFDKDKIQSFVDEKTTFESFFQQAELHPNAHMIKGVVCGYRIEEIDDEFAVYKQCRQMEKLIDELGKGTQNGKDIARRKRSEG